MTTQWMSDIDGYDEIQADIQVLRKYGFDYTIQRGKVQQLINMLHPASIDFRVSEVREETPTTKTLRLVSKTGYLPPFQAGQYINLFADIGGIRTSRPYSISSAPNQTGYYDLTVRRVADGFVSEYLLNDVKPGDSLTGSGPCGNFFYNPLFHGADLVFLAGGSGVTPFMSMLREVTDRGLDRRIHLIYGCADENDIIFKDELDDRATRHENFQVSYVISGPVKDFKGLTGFITAELIKQVVGDFKGKFFYICGPEVMYTFCLAEMEKLDLPGRKIKKEVFGPPKDPSSHPGWPDGVKISDVFKVDVRGRSIDAKAGETLMASMERAGIVIPSQCRSGECSMCRTKLLSGKVYHAQGARLRYSDKLYGYIHPCMAYPLENLSLLV
jgi:ferredoxin-NADP reductase